MGTTNDKTSQGRKNIFKGYASESALTAIFQAWEWTVSKPQPDFIGVDLIVQTDFSVTIAVQAKSKTSHFSKGKLSYKSACKIRDQTLPSFLFVHDRAKKFVYWVYLERLFHSDVDFLAGRDLKVSVVPNDRFPDSADECPSHLHDLIKNSGLRAGIKAIPDIRDYAREQERFYAEIDPNLRVTQFLEGDRSSSFTIQPTTKSIDWKYKINTVDPRARLALKELFEWGSELDIKASTPMGSRVFEKLFDTNASGQLKIWKRGTWSGNGILTTAGSANVFSVQVTLSQGHAGLECLLKGASDCFICRLRFPFSISNTADVAANFTIDFTRILGWSTKELYKLDGLRQVLEGLFPGSPATLLRLMEHPRLPPPIPLCWQSDSESELRGYRNVVAALDSMNSVANELGIQFDDQPIGILSSEDVDDWLTYAALLRGEKVELVRATWSFVSTSAPEFAAEYLNWNDFVLRGMFYPVNFRNVQIGAIPVYTDLIGYVIEVSTADSGGSTIKVRQNGPESTIYIRKA